MSKKYLLKIWIIILGTFSMDLIPQVPALPLQAQILKIPVLPAGNSGLVSCFPVCKSQSMHLAIFLPDDTYQPSLTGPGGIVVSWNLGATAYSCLMQVVQPDPNGTVLGYVYHFVVPSPANGQWSIQATPESALPSPWQSLVNIDFVSPLGGGLFLTAQRVTAGTPVSASLIVMDGPTVLSGFNCVATLTPKGNPSAAQPVTFSPITNPQSGNTTLVAQFTPTTSGTHSLTVAITGTTAVGPFERDLGTTINVYPKNASLSGQITQRVEIRFPPAPE
jgi:hypothetical protein